MNLLLEDLLRQVSDSGVNLPEPMIHALEAACRAISQRKPDDNTWHIAAAAQNAMPPDATEYERGFAAGLVLGFLSPDS